MSQPANHQRPVAPLVALCVAMVLVVGTVAVALAPTGTSAGDPVPAAADVTAVADADAARAACEGFVKQRLKAPATAQFTATSTNRVTDQPPGTVYPVYTVSGAVDSHNGFGALVRNNYVCEVTGRQSDWDLIGSVRFTGNG